METHVETDVTVTDNAAKRIAFLMSQEENPESVLRIAVEGGGCSGFQYKYSFVQEQAEDDLVLKKDEATVLIDSMSLEFMKGAVIDYIENLGGAYFEIRNPNSSANCGCGNSFAV